MNRFCVHKDFIFHKKPIWSFDFHDEFFEIQSIKFRGFKYDGIKILTRRNIKYHLILLIVQLPFIYGMMDLLYI